jgi:putative peptidoglycan lipid II flippase
MINALWLLLGLLRRGSYQPQAGWGRFVLQVLAASALVVIYLLWAAGLVDWVAMRSHSLLRLGWLALLLSGAVVVYLGAAWAAGLNLRQFVRR